MRLIDPAYRSPIETILLSLTAISALVVGGAAGARGPIPPQPQPLNAFFGNLHSHTSYSDGSGSPAEAYAHARDEAKRHFLALTEHNHAEALGLGKAAAPGVSAHPRSVTRGRDRSMTNPMRSWTSARQWAVVGCFCASAAMSFTVLLVAVSLWVRYLPPFSASPLLLLILPGRQIPRWLVSGSKLNSMAPISLWPRNYRVMPIRPFTRLQHR